jgi:hypothetical protein
MNERGCARPQLGICLMYASGFIFAKDVMLHDGKFYVAVAVALFLGVSLLLGLGLLSVVLDLIARDADEAPPTVRQSAWISASKRRDAG